MQSINLMHVAVHENRNNNCGDTMLSHATRRCFEYFLGPINWTLHQAWEPFDAAMANQHDGVVVGGGGMLLPDQDGANYEASGWQWNCTIEQLKAIKVPLIVFAIGYNRFRGQEDFEEKFFQHIQYVMEKSSFFSMRECKGRNALGLATVSAGLFRLIFQPCPTTCLWQLYPEFRAMSDDRILGVNVATDRANLRFGPGEETRTFESIADACKGAEQGGWEVRVICHKPQDVSILLVLESRGVRYKIIHLTYSEPRKILEAYAATTMVIGMRGHAQLIPFGLRKPIISIISHDKLKWFLDDIGHPEWGIEVSNPNFRWELADALNIAVSSTAIHQRDIAQEKCWAITTQNMARIAQILGVKVGA